MKRAGGPVSVEIDHQQWYSPGRLNRQEMLCRLKGCVLSVRVHRPWKTRHVQLLGLIAEAVALLGAPPMPPFYVNIGDRAGLRGPRPDRTRFGPCAVYGEADVAAPDFIFGGWPDAKFDDFDAKAREMALVTDAPPSDDRAFWAGRCFNDQRRRLLDIAAANPGLVEAVDMEAHYDKARLEYAAGFLPMQEQAAVYRYLIDVEGVGYSGRLKLLLHARRVVLLQERPWREWFFGSIEPFRHYVPVARDLSDLVERIEWLRANPLREAEIASEGQRFARRHLTRAAAVQEWARLLDAHIAAGGNLRTPPRAAQERQEQSRLF